MYQSTSKNRNSHCFKRAAVTTACMEAMLASAVASAATVDVLVAYDAAAATTLGGEPEVAMQSWVDQINSYYLNSNIDLQLRLAGTMTHEEDGADQSSTLQNLRTDSTVSAARESTGADFVVMVTTKANCGIGYISVQAAYAYSLVGPHCGPMTMAHELGHNMGLTHSRKQGDTSGVRYAYGLGHGVDYAFGTIMAYAHLYSTSRVGKFSNPDVQCNGHPCGVAAGDPEQADAARALNNVKVELSNFRAAVVAPPTEEPSPTEPTEPTTLPPEPLTYSLKAAHSGKCIEVTGTKRNTGATLAQWSCHGAANQQFTASAAGEYLSLQAEHSGKCMGIKGGSTADGERVIQTSCDTTDSSQLWTFQASGSYVNVINKNSGKHLEIRDSSTDNRAAVQQSSATDGDNQRFILVEM